MHPEEAKNFEETILTSPNTIWASFMTVFVPRVTARVKALGVTCVEVAKWHREQQSQQALVEAIRGTEINWGRGPVEGTSRAATLILQRARFALPLALSMQQNYYGLLLQLLPDYSAACDQVGAPITRWLIRLSDASGITFEDRPLGASAVGSWLQYHLQGLALGRNMPQYPARWYADGKHKGRYKPNAATGAQPLACNDNARHYTGRPTPILQGGALPCPVQTSVCGGASPHGQSAAALAGTATTWASGGSAICNQHVPP
eukprot:scaffold123505_cov15-Prasinocladus_malaysianus.AAC.1